MSSMIKNKLARYNKTELVDKLLKSILSQQESKKDSDNIISKLEDKIKKLEKENKILRANSIEVLTDEELMKEILKLLATGKSPRRVYEILNENRGLSVSMGEIDSVNDSLDNLSEETKAFFNEQKRLYFDNLSFDKENILLGDIQLVERMISSSIRALENMDRIIDEEGEDFNFEDYRKLQDHISKLIKNKSTILKSITGGNGDEDESEDFDIGYVEEESTELDLEIIEE